MGEKLFVKIIHPAAASLNYTLKNNMKKKAGLIILDGWGIGAKDDSDGVFLANTPFFDNLINNNPNAHLTTFGKEVGLPDGQMGNSEVGHLNIGAGRIVYQDLLRINNAIEDGSFFKNPQRFSHVEDTPRPSDRRRHLATDMHTRLRATRGLFACKREGFRLA